MHALREFANNLATGCVREAAQFEQMFIGKIAGQRP